MVSETCTDRSILFSTHGTYFGKIKILKFRTNLGNAPSSIADIMAPPFPTFFLDQKSRRRDFEAGGKLGRIGRGHAGIQKTGFSGSPGFAKNVQGGFTSPRQRRYHHQVKGRKGSATRGARRQVMPQIFGLLNAFGGKTSIVQGMFRGCSRFSHQNIVVPALLGGHIVKAFGMTNKMYLLGACRQKQRKSTIGGSQGILKAIVCQKAGKSTGSKR